ncbi:hypothetical protein GOBAR_DD24451 [Gossypium barbadense]|nr:hypothetical protein GOBAR_DD24451 [Gossypium barbadense]
MVEGKKEVKGDGSMPFVTFVSLDNVISSAFYLFKEEIVRTPMIYASIGLDFSCAAIATWILLLCTNRKCRNPNCRGLRKAAEFDIQLETEECVKNSNTLVKDGAKRGLFELPPDHHKELETELKKMAPVNGRAVFVFQARCGCSVGRLEVPGPKKQRKIFRTHFIGYLHGREVITSAEFHPAHCNMLAYSSSKGSIRLIDLRQSALYDSHAKLQTVVRGFGVQPKSDGYNFQSRSEPGGSRLQLGAGSGVSRLRSSSLKKPPEPLRRAVADCLLSSSLAAMDGGVSSHHQGGPLVLIEDSRTLRVDNGERQSQKEAHPANSEISNAKEVIFSTKPANLKMKAYRDRWIKCCTTFKDASVLTSIRLLLSEPNPDDGLMCEALSTRLVEPMVYICGASDVAGEVIKVGPGVTNYKFGDKVVSLLDHLGLTKLLADNAPKAMKEQKLESYFGRKIAIDTSMSIYQFLIVVGRMGTEMLTNEAGEVTRYGL